MIGEYERILARRDLERRLLPKQPKPVEVGRGNGLLEPAHVAVARGSGRAQRSASLAVNAPLASTYSSASPTAARAASRRAESRVRLPAELHLHARNPLRDAAAELLASRSSDVGAEATAPVERDPIVARGEQRDERYVEQARAQIPECDVDRRQRAPCDAGAADVSQRRAELEPERAVPVHRAPAHVPASRSSITLRRGFGRIRPAEPARPTGARFDDHHVVVSHSSVPSDSGESVGRVMQVTSIAVDAPLSPGQEFEHLLPERLRDHGRARRSPPRTAERNDFACSSEMCGGSGGTSRSTTASITNGRSAANASSHADSISIRCLDAHAVEPDQPREVRVTHVRDRLRRDVARVALHRRCSQVTWLRSVLFSTSTTRRGSAQRS